MAEATIDDSNYSSYSNYEHLENMYPDVYWRVYPMIMRYTEMYDVPSNPGFYPYPTRAAVMQMADSIYEQAIADPNFPMERQGRGFLRSLVLILLIRQLLRRRYVF